MIRYCEQCRDFHEENDLCPKYKELLKQHPEWFNEMMQTMVTSTISTPTVQKYGAAIKEHLVAYDGVDHERGTVSSRSLKSVAQSKVNPNDSARNIKQQAGFSAEIKSAARANAERIINGDDTTRTTRTDDLTSQSDGHGGSIGGTNDQFYDLAEVDKNGVYIEGSGRQLKFVGNDAESCTKSLLQKDYDKYRKHGVALEVPSDFYDKIVKELDKRADHLKTQIEVAERKGNTELASKHKEQLERVENTKNNLRKSNITSKEAIEARKHPELSTAKDIARYAHQAGLEAAKKGALIGGGVSIVRNVIKLSNGDIEADIAIKNIVIDTTKGAIGGYVVGAGGAALKGVMQNSSSSSIRALSETQFPGAAVGLVYGITKSAVTNFLKYKNGELSKAEMARAFGKDAVKGSLVTCSMAVIAFPPGVVGAVAAMGVAMYLDAACTNLLDEVFGEGAYEQILHACGYVASVSHNIVELLDEYGVNMRVAYRTDSESQIVIKEINATRTTLEAQKQRTKKLIEEL